VNPSAKAARRNAGNSGNIQRREGVLYVRALYQEVLYAMIKFLLWCILLVLCWPLALVALVLYPLMWLILLPFRIVGIAVDGVLELVKAIILLPVRVLRTV
jgi:hypothetical protein